MRACLSPGGLKFGDVAASCFGLADFAAAAGVLEAAFFIRGFGLERRDGNTAALRIDSDKGEIGGRNVMMRAGEGILDPDFDADFH